MNKDVKLSATRLGRAAAVADQERKFKFVVGKEESEYFCSLVQACFISERVCRLVENDSTIDVLRVFPDRNCDCFDIVKRLWNGESVSINKSNAESLFALNEELENEELNMLLVDFNLRSEDVSVENSISRLRLKSRLGLNFDDEIEFVSSNFFEFSSASLSGLSVSEFESILVHESLKIESENSLLDCILELIERDESFWSVLRYIQFEYLDCDHLEQFFKSVYPVHVDSVLWESITKFILNSVKKSPPKPRGNMRFVDKKEVFEYDASSPFKGIISRLREECGGNPHEKGVMNITASDTGGGNQCHQVVNYGWGGYWYSSNNQNSWIQFDFKNCLISVESYTIKTHGGTNKLRSWVIEGSNDASSWTQLHTSSTSWSCHWDVRHFTFSQTNETFFRYIRLRQTDTNYGGNHCLHLSEIEFFGALKRGRFHK